MKVWAHRGSSLIWPENTLLAFARAHEAGASGFETDLRLSADGQIVLCHDPDLARLGHPGVIVSQVEASRLGEMQVHSPDGTLADSMITLRTLLAKYPEKDYILDCKIHDALLYSTLRDLLDELRFHDRIWFLTWSAQADAHVARLFPGALRFPSYRRSSVWGAFSVLGLGRLAEPRSRLVSLPAHHMGLPVFGRRQVQSLGKRHKIFMGYLVNTRADLDRCVVCGVDRILTDRPDALK